MLNVVMVSVVAPKIDQQAICYGKITFSLHFLLQVRVAGFEPLILITRSEFSTTVLPEHSATMELKNTD
jgi:hypothetical protein